MITLVKEDGTGLANANTYADLNDATPYFEAHLYATDWTGATDERKKAALVMATRSLDGAYDWAGTKTNTGQALQWPRMTVPDRNAPSMVAGLRMGIHGPYLDENAVPVEIVNATLEFAKALLTSDRTGDVQGQGIKRVKIEGALEVEFDPSNPVPTVPDYVRNMLANLGFYRERNGGQVRVVRT